MSEIDGDEYLFQFKEEKNLKQLNLALNQIDFIFASK